MFYAEIYYALFTWLCITYFIFYQNVKLSFNKKSNSVKFKIQTITFSRTIFCQEYTVNIFMIW